MTLTSLVQSFVYGLLTGGLYASLGIGFSLTWGSAKLLNIAHPTFSILACYIAYWLQIMIGMDPFNAILLITPLFFLLGITLYASLIRLVCRAKDVTFTSMIFTVGLAVFLENLISFMWSPSPKVMVSQYTGASFIIANIHIPINLLLSFFISLALIATTYFFIYKTFLGKAVRATWQNPDAAALYGINKNFVTMIMFGLAIATGGAAGVCFALISSFYPALHNTWIIYLFIVVIMGGVGSVYGTLAGGMLLGLFNSIVGLFIPNSWLPFIVYVALIILLWVRPEGLFKA
jgi:branched-chain amino acid transport system permease protein